MDESLSFESFLGGAKKAAHKAMDDHGRSEYDEFALHAGVAVERLAKAVLVRKNPIYLVEMRNGPSDLLLYFGGHLEIETEKVRTVGAGEALKRLRRVGVLPTDPQLDLLIELRNGTAHTTVGDQAKALLPTLAETVGTLLTDIEIDFAQFWGRWSSAVHVAIDRHRNEVQRDVEIRIKQARHLFDDRFKGLPTAAKKLALQLDPPDVDFDFPYRSGPRPDTAYMRISIRTPCPACGGNARLGMMAQSMDLADGFCTPDLLACHFCNLELNSAEEIVASGADVEKAELPTSVSFSLPRTAASGMKIGRVSRG
ncbi:hypothetical protein [Streptomyces sp. NPDC002690]